LKYYLTFYWLVIQLAYFHTNSVGYYVDSIPEFVIIMRRNVLIYSFFGMIHTKNGFIGEDDCSNDPRRIIRVSFFSSLILPFLSIILYVIIDLQTYYIYRPTSPRISIVCKRPSYIVCKRPSYIVCKRILLVVVVIELPKFEDCSKFQKSTSRPKGW